MAAGLRVRAATRADLPRILDIHNDAVLTTTAVFHYAPQTLDEREAWFDARRSGGWPVVAVADSATDDLLGYGSYGPFRAWPAYKYSVEHSVYVDDRDKVWLSDWTANAMVRFDPETERFEAFPSDRRGANVRQILGRPGEVWAPESGTDRLVVYRMK